jgi:tyrosyl-tRNA synthetase
LLSILVDSGLVLSKSEGRRVILQNGVKVNQKVVSNPGLILKKGEIIQKGKINFLKIV